MLEHVEVSPEVGELVTVHDPGSLAPGENRLPTRSDNDSGERSKPNAARVGRRTRGRRRQTPNADVSTVSPPSIGGPGRPRLDLVAATQSHGLHSGGLDALQSPADHPR